MLMLSTRKPACLHHLFRPRPRFLKYTNQLRRISSQAPLCTRQCSYRRRSSVILACSLFSSPTLFSHLTTTILRPPSLSFAFAARSTLCSPVAQLPSTCSLRLHLQPHPNPRSPSDQLRDNPSTNTLQLPESARPSITSIIASCLILPPHLTDQQLFIPSFRCSGSHHDCERRMRGTAQRAAVHSW